MTYIITVLSILFLSVWSFAGLLQGGGGGPQNKKIKRYLDPRSYALDGALINIVPKINIVNACLHVDDDGLEVHTIKKIIICEQRDAKDKCVKPIKTHFSAELPLSKPACKKSETIAIAGEGIKHVCIDEDIQSFVAVPLVYPIDVYLRNLGNGRGPLRPRVDEDRLIRRIKYKIPKCEEIEVEE